MRSEFEQGVQGVQDGLLAGEEPETDQPEDIEHWIAVYTELIEGTRRLQAVVSASEQRVDDEIQRLCDRLAFWLDRRARLSCRREDAEPA
ncbi:MAG TPA: hypothetical protein VLW53_02470 [Candidatus Eisenbacteria bacterium]|nr:hypothetical protein [Candidatus Eisenbacteria bacterium]